MQMRIVVADESEARFYDAAKLDGPVSLTGKTRDPAARLHDRDLKSDRPGRVFDHAAPGGRGFAHHSTGGENTPRSHEAAQFAHRIAAQLESEWRSRHFEHLVLVAGPPFLGALRAALPEALRRQVTREIPKDLIHQDDDALRTHLAAAEP
ncbi:MAG TPA: host attachment protein [Steroidobacteraceae bacterium]|nr:host attachment protein [Steroidobacteraceae bacterium]